MALIRWATFLN